MLDNTSAVADINNLGGTVSLDLVSLAKNLWLWYLERNVYITAQVITSRIQPKIIPQLAGKLSEEAIATSLLRKSRYLKTNRSHDSLFSWYVKQGSDPCE